MSYCVPNWGVESSSLATHKPPPGAAHTTYRENADLVPWFDGRAGEVKAVATPAAARDAVVPCAVSGEDDVEGALVAPDSEGGCTRVGSCSGPATWEFFREDEDEDEGSVNASSFARVPVAEEGRSGVSAGLDTSDTFGGDSSRRVPAMSSSERELSESLTTSFFSLDDTFASSWRSDTENTTPSNDSGSSSVFRGRKQREESNKEETSKSSTVPTKRSRCSRTDQPQRKKNSRIDQRMKKLQRLVPTSKRQTEDDKEWVLDEVIEYVQKLQAQLRMMMMMPIPMMSMPMMPMGMQGYRHNPALPCLFPAVCMPAPPWSVAATAYPQSQRRPTVEEAHSRMAASSVQQQEFPFIFQRGNFF